MSKRVRLGLIGAGGIGSVHADAVQQCTGVELTAICDVDAGRATSLAAQHQVARSFTDYRKMLTAGMVDAVAVCTPNNTHRPITLAALEAGCDVLCEKPIAMNAQEAKRMVEAAKAGKRILMIAQALRYGVEAQYIKKLADAGRFGNIYYGKAVWYRRAGIPRGWFQDRKQSGGGPLIDLGVHAIDLLWWLMGQPQPVSAFAVTFDRLGTKGVGMGTYAVGYNPGKFNVEDLFGAIIRFADGRAISVDISWATHTEETFLLRIMGEKAGAQISPKAVIYETVEGIQLDTTPRLREQNSYAVEYQHFLECVRTRRQPISPGSQALIIQTMLDAISASARTGKSAPIRAR